LDEALTQAQNKNLELVREKSELENDLEKSEAAVSYYSAELQKVTSELQVTKFSNDGLRALLDKNRVASEIEGELIRTTLETLQSLIQRIRGE
jgi:hypothetical protein